MSSQRRAKKKQVARAPSLQAKERLGARRLSGIADGPDGRKPAWRLSLLDLHHEGNWSWKVTGEDLREIIDFLSEMERLKWPEVLAQLTSGKKASHRKHHSMPTAQLCVEAKRRLEAIQLDDVDHLFRFRLGNKRRLWGVLAEDVFYPVWWDADHKVYPTDHDLRPGLRGLPSASRNRIFTLSSEGLRRARDDHEHRRLDAGRNSA